MTRAAEPPILEQLQNAESASAQITALRALKNELIGHDQRKEVLVTEGIIPALSQVLTSRWPATNRNESVLPQDRSTHKNPEDYEACLQATLVVGSLAQGMRRWKFRALLSLQVCANSLCYEQVDQLF
jgi:hypothetical protein